MGTLHDHGHTVNLTALLDSTQVSLAASTPVRLTSSDSILALISSRYKRDEPSTWLGDSTLVSLNPFQVLASASEASQKDYRQRAYNISAGSLTEGHPARLQPHPYELACRVYLTMKRTGESQSVVFSGLSGSGASTQLSLFTSQLLLLSSYTKKDSRVADQVAALETVLSSFGCAKTVVNPNASRHSTFTELHFSHSGRLAGAKVLAFGLDKTRTWKLGREERTFHAFYQLLAGATHEERAELGLLDDVTSYGLLASSGTYRLPAGPRSNDSIELDNLRGALKVLGFKPRHISSIFRLLSAILLLSNLEFADRGDRDLSSESAWITNHDVLDRVSSLLGVMPDDLERGLTNRVRYVRKEMCAVLLKSEGAAKQRDTLMSSLYSILFAFVVETCNHKLFPGDEAIAALQKAGGSSILTLDAPGFHSLVPSRPGVTQIALIHALNSFTEFTNNYTSSLVQFWLTEHQFDGDAGVAARAQEDGVRMKDVVPPSDESARMELLRGGRVGGKADRKPGGVLGGMSKTCANVRKGILMSTTDEADDELLRGMRDHFGAHTAFVSTPAGPGGRHAFGIQHWAGTVAYDVTNFVESDLDAVDPEFVALLRGSDDGFVAKLFSGPSMAAETHPLDDRTIVAAQVSSMPLRRPSPVVPLSSFPPTDVDYTLPFIDPLAIHPRSSQLNATIAGLLNLLERTKIWQVISLRPNDTLSPGMIDTSRLKHQIAAFHLPELIARKQIDYIYDHAVGSFAARHGVDVTPGREQDSVSAFLRGVGLKESDDFALGIKRVWLSYAAWKLVEDRLREGEPEETRVAKESSEERSGDIVESLSLKAEEAGEWAEGEYKGTDSVDDLLMKSRSESGAAPSTPFGDGGYHATLHSQQQQQHQAFQQQQHLQNQDYLSYPGAAAPYIQASRVQSDVWGGLAPPPAFNYQHPAIDHRVLDADGIPRESAGATVEEIPASRGRRIWVAMVWSLTWWIPSITLKYLGRMKRPDVRMAWREKVALCMLIGFFCGVVIFYIVVFGKLICPNYDKAWNTKEVGFHSGGSDYWVSVRGSVYDLTNFYKLQHSDITGQPVTVDDMLSLAGMDLTDYFPIPLTSACPTLVSDQTLALQYLNFSAIVPTAVHTSGSLQGTTSSELYNPNWYSSVFIPRMTPYLKGPLVWDPKTVASQAQGAGRLWAIIEDQVYDLTDYYNTITLVPNNPGFNFLNSQFASLWQGQSGTDITTAIAALNLSPSVLKANMDCVKTLFYVGQTDFRLTARCQVQPYLLLTFSLIIVTTILAKFLAALQLGSKRSPELRDKFVICQVPCYTEGEESLKKTIDSLATLTYDDKRKLLLIICDGMIIGSGNDRPTPRIVLDILGVDQSVDPDPLMFKSISEGSKQLNYGKVWSGLYEVDGHVVPYLVVAKIGRPSERSRPGNRGKRDSQILAMRFLNRVHFDSEMYPLELEMYHQIKNVIGVDPQLYEYMLVIDADTSVAPESLNRLVSCAADDSKIIGICGETKLENEQASWWTMIQVYEYYLSHHMSKAFESLFGSVTCLPGCFTMYRIRSADKGKPLLVSSLIIDEYSECNLDTLHKKNLLSLGEDRYLTTLILKHFPNYKTKFTPDALAMTVAPDRWSILISQRRRWINSTVHNLAELMFLPDMCGFCCFGMRFIVMIDLVGTLILPATFVYLVYLVVTVASGSSSIPILSLIILGAVYGLQMLIFLLKRQWQFIGWLVIYLLAYPIYSFVLPIYSFWCFDDFTWGSTRVVVGEGKSKKVLQHEDETFDESSIPLKKFSEYQAALLADDDDRRSIHSSESRQTQSTAGFSLATKFPQGPGGGGSYHGGPDYYRDTMHSRAGSRSTFGAFPTMPSFYAPAPPGSQYGGSEFGYPAPSPTPSPFHPALTQRQSTMSFSPTQMSFSGIPQMATRDSHMSGLNYGAFPPPSALPTMGSRMSLNPFLSPSPTTLNISESLEPTDDEIVSTLKTYLAQQDLMQVTKRSAREGLATFFPRADLKSKKDFINSSIDAVLQGRL